jgi:hypothetical protein
MTKFAVIYKETRAEHDYYDPDHPRSVQVEVLKEFDDEIKLLEWIENNDKQQNAYWRKSFRAFRLEELTVERKLSFSIKP